MAHAADFAYKASQAEGGRYPDAVRFIASTLRNIGVPTMRLGKGVRFARRNPQLQHGFVPVALEARALRAGRRSIVVAIECGDPGRCDPRMLAERYRFAAFPDKKRSVKIFCLALAKRGNLHGLSAGLFIEMR